MKLFAKISVTTLALLLACQAGWAATINLNPFTHVRGPGVTYSPFVLNLDPGQYQVTPVIGAYTAFSPWGSNANCNPSCDGTNGQGYGHYFGIIIDGTEIVGRDDTWNGLFYNDPNHAFANAVQGVSFTLTSNTDVELFIPTGAPLSDNRGGISLDVSLVPAPPAALLFLSGIGSVIAIRFKKKSKQYEA